MWLYSFVLVLTMHCPDVVIFFCSGTNHALSRCGYILYVPARTIHCPGVVIFYMFRYLPDAVQVWLYSFGLVLTIDCPDMVIFFCSGTNHALSRRGYILLVWY